VLYFTLSSETQATKEVHIQSLAASQSVSWVSEHGGEYEYAMGICARSLDDVMDLLNLISTQHGNIFFDKSFSIRRFIALFGRQYLGNDAPIPEPFTAGGHRNTFNADETDTKILSLMVHSGDASSRQLAQQADIPLTTFERRKKRLEKAGVIPGYVAGIYSAKFGMHKFRLLLCAKGINPLLREELFQYAKRTRSVTLFVECIGNWDFEMFVEIPEPRTITRITRELYAKFSSELTSIKVLSVFGYTKFRMYPFYDN